MKAPVLDESARFIGRVLRDKWRIDTRIARGGVATVYAATHRNNGHRVAIKILHSDLARDEDARSRFLQEGYAANKVGHPGITRILDDDVTDEGAAFLVMELLEGELLEARRVRKGGSLPLAEVLSIGDQLLDVLISAHGKGIVHRDIKPDNLFLLRDGTLKVLDFGFAQMKDGLRKEQTATGFLLGTPGFMSPEQALGSRGQIDAQTDIWAVGATLFICLSGRPVHEAESVAEALVAAANFRPRSLRELVPGLPSRVIDVIDKALAFDKSERFPDARSMQHALRVAAAGGPPLESTTRAVAGQDYDVERTISENDIQLGDLDMEVVSSDSQTLMSERPADSDDVPTIAAQSPVSIADRSRALPSMIDEADSERGSSTVVMQGSSVGAQTAPRPAAGLPAPRPAAGMPAAAPAGPTSTPSFGGGLGSSGARPSLPSGGYPPLQTGPFPAPSPLAVGGGGVLINTPPQPFSTPPVDARPSAPAVPPDLSSARASQAAVQSSQLPTYKIKPQEPEARGGKNVLVLVGIAVLSMAIVLVAGLAVLAAAD